MRTLVIIGHPEVDDSQSHQFLLQTGQAMTDVTYFDLGAYYQEQQKFDPEIERNRLKEFDRIIFQFQLYWYQAPAILKAWFDQAFPNAYQIDLWRPILVGKEMGTVVLAGTKLSAYRTDSGQRATLSELLSPYRAFAHYWQMTYLPYFAVGQLAAKNSTQQWRLMFDYVTYLETGRVGSFRALQQTILSQLGKLIDQGFIEQETEALELDLFYQQLVQQADLLEELYMLEGEEVE
ncbi:NAD(P)H-dependent oxidoreductase [Ignavigranum ruoffiae]|uniref:NAD(P)H-dependent oxidoreductase n=1 Tax=Ignavigranum ruoffiae TaxID=89093 RepID=UPI0024ADD915|nr:NAD(P)H-dependent oxidoreductase [Ignavigranum ruoffiae]